MTDRMKSLPSPEEMESMKKAIHPQVLEKSYPSKERRKSLGDEEDSPFMKTNKED